MSLPARFAVDVDELEAKVEAMGAFEVTVEETLHHLDRVVAGLHLTWTGQAAVAHEEAHRLWTDGMAEMRDALTVIRAAATRAHANYSRAAETNVAMWSSVR